MSENSRFCRGYFVILTNFQLFHIYNCNRTSDSVSEYYIFENMKRRKLILKYDFQMHAYTKIVRLFLRKIFGTRNFHKRLLI